MTRRMGFHFVLSILPALACAQGPIRGPMVGWVWDSRQEAIRPILGITGSSVLGKAVDLGFAVKYAAISGRQESALILGGDQRTVYLVDLRGVTPDVQRLEVTSGASSLTRSPRGSSAALWFADTNKLLLLSGLGSTVAATELDLSLEGAPAAIAISDDGTMVLAAYPDVPLLLAIDKDGNRTKVVPDVAVRAVTFLEDSHDAAFTSPAGLHLIRSVPAVSELTLVSTGDTFAAVSPLDPRRVLLIDGTESVVEVNVESGAVRQAQCPCNPTVLNRMSSTGTFRLNEVSSDPLWLVEISESGLRTVFVPPDPTDPGTEDK